MNTLTTPLEALTGKERKFLDAYLANRSVQNAAQQAGIDYTTALRMKKSPHVKKAIAFCDHVSGYGVFTDKSKVTQQLAGVAELTELPVVLDKDEGLVNLDALRAVTTGMRAIEHLSKLHGWNAPQELDVQQHVTKGLDDKTLDLLGRDDDQLPVDIPHTLISEDIFD